MPPSSTGTAACSCSLTSPMSCTAAILGEDGYVAVADPDAHFARARDAGALLLSEPHDAFDEAMRGYSARDPEGNLWSYGTDRPGG